MPRTTILPIKNSYRWIRILTLCAALCSMWASVAHAVIYWDEGFESGTLIASGWKTGSCANYFPNNSPWAEGCNPLRITGSVTAGTVHSGTHSLRGDYESGCLKPTQPFRECGQYFDRAFPTTTEVYVRFWYRTTGFTYDSSVTKNFYLAGPPGPYPDVVVGHLYGSRSTTAGTENQIADGPPCSAGQRAAGVGGCNYSENVGSVPINDGQWYCIEVHTKYNTPGVANGVMELWVNGTRTVNYTNRTFVGTLVNGPGGNSSATIFNRFRFYVQAGTGMMYYDDVAVGNTRIGCGGTSGDTTPPAQPKNFIVSQLESWLGSVWIMASDWFSAHEAHARN